MHEILGSHSDEHQDFSLLGYDAIQSGRKDTILEKSGSFIYGVKPFYPDDRGNRQPAPAVPVPEDYNLDVSSCF